jgi:uncharacterized phage protein (TIGR02220 family)
MARPKKEGLDYFSHDTDAVNDEKIEALRLLYGNDGYAFYFILLERIYRTTHFELDVSDAETIQILSKKVGVNEGKFEQILQTSLKRGCFDLYAYENRKVLTSNGIKKRAGVVVEKREKMRENYQQNKRGVSDAETIPETPQSKVKESKEKNSKEKNSNMDIPFSEIITYLNGQAKTNYKSSSKKTIDLIKARWNEGFILDDFKTVINKKTAEWINNKEMSKYLRPETLFGTKFESYLNQKDVIRNGTSESRYTGYNFEKEREFDF